MMRNNSGTGLIEVLIAVAVLVFLAIAITGLATVSTRILAESERQTVAISIVNEELEVIRSALYDDIVLDSRTITRNGQEYEMSSGPGSGSAFGGPVQGITVRVSWTGANGAVRDVEATTFVANAPGPANCGSCPGGTACDPTTGACLGGGGGGGFGGSCETGLLCEDGAFCNATRSCGYDPIGADEPGPAQCRAGQLCATGAPCPIDGICPINICGTGVGCGGDGVCFNGYCYSGEAYSQTFNASDATGPIAAVPNLCQSDACGSSFDCPGTCTAGGSHVIWLCEQGWNPECGGGSACQGAWKGGVCVSGQQIDHVACPAGGRELPDGRKWCDTDNKECGLSSLDCPSAEASVYWGGWGRGCQPHGVTGVINAPGGIGACSVGGAGLGAIGITLEHEGPDQSLPFEFLEGDSGDTLVKIKVKMAGPSAQQVRMNIELRNGTATIGEDFGFGAGTIVCEYADWIFGRCGRGSCVPPLFGSCENAGPDPGDAPRKVITFEPGQPIEQEFKIAVHGDLKGENHETFTVIMARGRSNNASVFPRNVLAFTIVNDEITLSVEDMGVVEGNSGDDVKIDFILVKAGTGWNSPQNLVGKTNVSVSWDTQDIVDGAKSGEDYDYFSDTHFFPATQSIHEEIPFTVNIISDDFFEIANVEEFLIKVLATSDNPLVKALPLPVGWGGVGSITEDEPWVSVSAPSLVEGGPDRDACASLQRGPLTFPVSGGVTPVYNGTATSDDFSGGDYFFSIGAGESSDCDTMSASDDGIIEGSEDFTLEIDVDRGAFRNPENFTSGGSVSDPPLPPPP